MQQFQSRLQYSLVRISFSCDGRLVLVADRASGVEIWDRFSAREVEAPQLVQFLNGRFHPSIPFGVLWDRQQAVLLDLATFRITPWLAGPGYYDFDVQFGPDGSLVAQTETWPSLCYTGFDLAAGGSPVTRWRVETGVQQEWQYGYFGMSGCGGWFGLEGWRRIDPSLYRYEVQLRSAGTGDRRLTMEPAAWHLRGILDRDTLLVSDRDGLAAWDVPGRSVTRRVTLPGRSSDLAHVARSPDGNRLVAGRRETVCEVDAETMQITRELAFPIKALIHCVAYSPDGLTAAFGTGKRRFVIWDVD